MSGRWATWRAEALRYGAAIALLAVAGVALGAPLTVFLLGALAALGWNLFNLARLQRWLQREPKPDLPHAEGLWGAVFDGLHRLERRHRKRHHNLTQLWKKMRETVDAMPDAAVILHGDGETQWWNRAARELIGLGGATDQGQRISKLFRNPRFTDYLFRSAESGAPIVVPSPVNADILLEVRIVPYGDEQYLLLARDVTRLERLERTRRDFVANVSHELRTPLTSVVGMAELLVEHPDTQQPELRRSLGLIEQQAQRMQRLVEDLLMLSRLETDQGPRESASVDVPALLHTLVEEARVVSAQRGHRLHLEAEPGLWLRGTESDLRSAFSNLVFNAVQYTPDGGAIEVRWRRGLDGSALLSVKDEGIGVAPQDVPRLTERFYRVDKARSVSRGGTGLGLAIVKHVLERHGARLDIESRLGEGSCFCCRFPASIVVQRDVDPAVND